MKIANLELFKVPPRWLFLKISADDGLAGWGEPIVEGRADTVAAAVTELSHYLLLHQDLPRNISATATCGSRFNQSSAKVWARE